MHTLLNNQAGGKSHLRGLIQFILSSSHLTNDIHSSMKQGQKTAHYLQCIVPLFSHFIYFFTETVRQISSFQQPILFHMSTQTYNTLYCIKTIKPGKAINTMTETEIREVRESCCKSKELCWSSSTDAISTCGDIQLSFFSSSNETKGDSWRFLY